MGSKIIADVEPEVKQKLEDVAHYSRQSMKDVLVRLIEGAYEKEVNNKK